jgi:hypothetical protein
MTIFAPVSMEKTQQIITQILDFFYPIFSRFLNKQTYYYLACGGGNTLFGLILYYLFTKILILPPQGFLEFLLL